MSALALLALFAIGLLVGFAAGLIGIGGGVLIVPFLYLLYSHPAFAGAPASHAQHDTVAHATSLFVILPTAVRGTWSYSQAGLVAWRVVLPVALAALIGAVGGAQLAILLPAEVLKLVFGIFLIASGLQLITSRGSAEERPLNTSFWATTITGLLVGLLSGMMGVGGGILALPLLMYLLHVDVRRAAASSLAIVGVAALGGVLTYGITGIGEAGRAPLSLGYIHYGAGLPILLGSMLSVHWGTVVNQRMHSRALRITFALAFIAMGILFVIKNLGALVG